MRTPPYLASGLSSFEHPSPITPVALFPARCQSRYLCHRITCSRIFVPSLFLSRFPPSGHKHITGAIDSYLTYFRCIRRRQGPITSLRLVSQAFLYLHVQSVLGQFALRSILFSSLRWSISPSSILSNTCDMSTPLSPVVSVCCHVFRAISVLTASVSAINNSLSLSHLTWFSPLLSLIA